MCMLWKTSKTFGCLGNSILINLGGNMTKEAYLRASELTHDIDTLEEVQFTFQHNRWVGFVTADNSEKILPMESKMLKKDFEEFVNTEIKKLNEELEKL